MLPVSNSGLFLLDLQAADVDSKVQGLGCADL